MTVPKYDPILPGAVLGVLGSGQLGRMFALAARQMGYRVHTLSPDADSPTGQVADREYVAEYSDMDAIRTFASGVSVVTFEFENVPSETVEAIDRIVPARPGDNTLHVAQNRLREKLFLRAQGIPHAPFKPVASFAELDAAVAEIGVPSILKTAGFGYDGKGQFKLRSADDSDAAWTEVGMQSSVLEQFVPFDFEISVVGARGVDGACALYPPIVNAHHNHILDLSVSPSLRLNQNQAAMAGDIARQIMDALDLVGVLCVEFFVARNGDLLVNEIAPRPHNSGHLTIEASVTSQFEQQVRAICGLPLGDTRFVAPYAAMANILGDLWPQDGMPDWAAGYAVPGSKWHLYGKKDPREGRKMGHITAVGTSEENVLAVVRQARAACVREQTTETW